MTLPRFPSKTNYSWNTFGIKISSFLIGSYGLVFIRSVYTFSSWWRSWATRLAASFPLKHAYYNYWLPSRAPKTVSIYNTKLWIYSALAWRSIVIKNFKNMTEKKICNLSYTSGNNLRNIKTALINIEGKRMESEFSWSNQKLNLHEMFHDWKFFMKNILLY